jgi:uncharacterized protein (DUF4213/DUF364 family)
MSTLYDALRQKTLDICRSENLLHEHISVRARTLSTEEAIGNPEDQDFPLQKGNERLMQAEFRGSCGQAFTDRFGDFEGTLEDILSMPLANNFRRAVFVASLNAVMRSLGRIQGTVHCRDEEPKACAEALGTSIRNKYGVVKITQAGFQPRMIQALAPVFPLRVLDLDPENIGTTKFGVAIEGPEHTAAAIVWADLLLVTGTVLINGTIDAFLKKKPVIFYGTTIAGAACLMGWDRFCDQST